jgi:predicted Fe-Mo cluster-binding NifX family protein
MSTPLNVVVVALLSIPILYLLSRYTKQVGEEIESHSLLGQAADFSADIYSSSLVLIGVVGYQFGYAFVEGVAGSIISLFVLKTGLVLGWNALLVLMDAVVKPERLEILKQVAEGVTGVRSVSNVRIRRSGPFCFGELTIGVDQRLSVDQAHRLSEEIEKRVRERLSSIESLLVHVEPQKQTQLRIAIPITEDKGVNSQATPHFGSAPYFLFVDVEDGSIQRWMTRSNPGRSLERKRGLTTADLLMRENVNTLLTGSIGAGPFHILRDSFIEIYELPEEIIAHNAVKDFLEARFERMEEAKEEKKS